MALANTCVEQDLDSTHFGNKTRFVNNSSHEAANCESKNSLCKTVHRIGLYATKDMAAGTELFFHYGYAEAQTKDFKEPGVKNPTVVAVKAKSKAATPSSSKTRQGGRVRLSTPERRKQTEKARAALHAKYNMDQATVPSSADSTDGRKQARKSVPRPGALKPTRGPHQSKVDNSDGVFSKKENKLTSLPADFDF